jgi:hypothetical protein
MCAALLDTNVLWPSLQRDVLLSLAVEDIYRPLWSSAALDELAFHEARKLCQRGIRSETAEARAARLIAAMRQAFADSDVAGWEGLEGTFDLPDENDEHVLAAAVRGGAGALVTHNVTDFPTEQLPLGLELQSPPDFAHHAVSVQPAAATSAIHAVSARTGIHGPSLTIERILTILDARNGFTDAVRILREEATAGS